MHCIASPTKSNHMSFLLYGANGYTGKLILAECKNRGLSPVVAGRNREQIEALAHKYDCPFEVFPLDDPHPLQEKLEAHSLCINAAGPFSRTARPLANACLATRTHYLDITGEIAVFEALKQLDDQAVQAGITIMPGVGFDVVPSDCLANYLKEQLPEATSLELTIASRGGGISHGTMSTMIESLGQAGAVRQDEKIQAVPIAHKHKQVDFGHFSRTVATIPWGDISTAFTSTGIPNIEVYSAMTPNAIRLLQYQQWFNPLLRSGLIKKLLQRWVDRKIDGPSPEQNQQGSSHVHGVVRSATGRQCAVFSGPEGYRLTALCTVHIAGKVLANEVHIGYQTPAGAYGWQLIEEVPGTEIRAISCEE